MAAKKDLPTKKTMEYINKNLKTKPGMKVTKKVDPMKTSAKSHQKDLAQTAGSVAAKNKAVALKKAKQKMGIMDQTGAAKSKAIARTLKSFK